MKNMWIYIFLMGSVMGMQKQLSKKIQEMNPKSVNT